MAAAVGHCCLGNVVKPESFRVFVGDLEVCLIVTAFAGLSVIDAVISCAWGARLSHGWSVVVRRSVLSTLSFSIAKRIRVKHHASVKTLSFDNAQWRVRSAR